VLVSQSAPLGATTYEKWTVQDISQVLKPQLLDDLGPGYAWTRFVSASEISYWSIESIVRISISGGSEVPVATPCNGLFGLSWSPDGTALAYLTDSSDASRGEVHVVSGGEDRILAMVAPFPTDEICSEDVCRDYDTQLRFSADGKKLAMVAGDITTSVRVWSLDGQAVFSQDAPAGAGPGEIQAWSVWAGDDLYFRDVNGIERWRNGSLALVLPGVGWRTPTASPDGAHIAYMALDSTGSFHIYIVDTTTLQVTDVASSRAWPLFLSARYLEYGETVDCPNGPCGPGITYVYDMQTGSETGWNFDYAYDAWPRTV